MIKQFARMFTPADQMTGRCELVSFTLNPRTGAVRLVRRKMADSPGPETQRALKRWEYEVARRRRVAVFTACLTWPRDGAPRPADDELLAALLPAVGRSFAQLGG